MTDKILTLSLMFLLLLITYSAFAVVIDLPEPIQQDVVVYDKPIWAKPCADLPRIVHAMGQRIIQEPLLCMPTTVVVSDGD